MRVHLKIVYLTVSIRKPMHRTMLMLHSVGAYAIGLNIAARKK